MPKKPSERKECVEAAEKLLLCARCPDYGKCKWCEKKAKQILLAAERAAEKATEEERRGNND